jgi:hypothetical protein
MGIFLDLYKLKVKVFLGAIRSTRASLLLVILYLVGTLPGSIGAGIGIVNTLKGGLDPLAYLDVLSAILSCFLAMVIFATLRGFVVFEYEQNLIFTSPVTPRLFLLVSSLADITALSFFLLPLGLFFGVIIVSLQLSFVSTLLMASSIFLFIFFLFFVKASFSILESTRSNSTVKAAIIILMFFLLLPAVNFVVPFPIKYSSLPYPSTVLANTILNILSNETLLSQSVSSLFLVSCYFVASFAFFFFCSSENLFQHAKPVPFVSPFDTSMQMQTAKMGKNIQFFSRVGLRLTLGLNSASLLRFLMKKELIRMIRDGSLFTVFLFYIIVSIMSLVGQSSEIESPGWLFLLMTYSFIIPFLLLSNWRISELDTLWIPLTSGIELKFVIKSLLYDLTLIAFIVPAGTITVLTFISPIDPLGPLVLVTVVSMIGCSSNLYTMMHFLSKQRRATPALMINWLSIMLSGLLTSPAYIYIFLSMFLGFSLEMNLLLAVPVLFYSGVVFWLFSRKIEKKALRIEI